MQSNDDPAQAGGAPTPPRTRFPLRIPKSLLIGIAAAVAVVGAIVAVTLARDSGDGRSSAVEANNVTPRATLATSPAATATSTAAPLPSATPIAATVPPTAEVAVATTAPTRPVETSAPPPPQPIPSEAPSATLPPTETTAPRSDPTAGLRDKYLQPFSSDSIWNMPLGSAAVYVPAGIDATSAITVDQEYWLVTDASMPNRQFFTNATFGPGRCETGNYEFDIRIPDSFVVPDASDGSTPNAVAAILLPDGHTIEEVNPISRCQAGGPLTAGWLAPSVDIYGPGTLGGHGGSHLSSIGGSLRLGELTSTEPIRHVLKVNLFGHRFLSQAQRGFRWPATAADSSALGDPANIDSYAGGVPALRMGSLLALPPNVDIAALGLTTEAATKLAWTLQNYGAYVVDDTSWNAHALDAETGVVEEFVRAYGTNMEATSGPWYQDMMRLFSALSVVDNNRPASVGGGGAPLQPLAPPIGN